MKGASACIEAYIDRYNNERLHSSLNYIPLLKVYNARVTLCCASNIFKRLLGNMRGNKKNKKNSFNLSIDINSIMRYIV